VVTVRIPTVLRSLTGGAATVAAGGDTVVEVLRQLATAHPGLAERLFDESGAIRPFVNVFVDDEDIRFAQGLSTAVADGQTVSILPAVAGG
jgi:molybdopterin synthase sulfur carrier subunit